MVTIPTGLAINTSVSGDRTIPSAFRKIMASLFKQDLPGHPIVGIIPAPNNPLLVIQSASAMSYTINAGFAVTARDGQGAYIVGFDGTAITLATTAASATYPRYDVIYIVQPDPELTESGVARVDVVHGTASASPAKPAIPTGAMELAYKIIPAGATNTSTGTAITNSATQVSLNTTDDTTVSGHKIIFSQTDPGAVADGTVWRKW